jgi:phage baseplate assembly protein V
MPELGEKDEGLEAHDDDNQKIRGKIDAYDTMLGGIVRIGRVVKEKSGEDPKDPGDIPRVLVQIGGSEKGSYVRNWLPWVTVRAGYDGEWWHPDLDEQVLVLAPSGNITQGFIVGSLYRGCLTFDSGADGAIEKRDLIPASETDKQIHYRTYQDGTSVSYDRNLHELAVKIRSAPDAKDENPTLLFSALMDPEGATAGTGKATLQIGDQSAPDFAATVDSTSGEGGELQLVSTRKATLIAGTVGDPKVTLLADASKDGEESLVLSVSDGTTNATIKNDGTITLSSGGTSIAIAKDSTITLSAGKTTITVNQDGAVDIDAGSNDITIKGNVAVTGTLDVK